MNHGKLAAVLTQIANGGVVDLTTDGERRSLVRANANTPTDAAIASWYRFEAALTLEVLDALSAQDVRTVEAALSAGDDALLEGVS